VSISASRLTYWRGRQPLGALLALVYFWAFVAVGLTHSHAPLRTMTCCPDSGAAAVQPAAPAITPAAVSAEDTSCHVCAAVHATAVALVSPPAAGHTPVPANRLAASHDSPAPARSLTASQPRAPPQA
jgi:hypothetical protein